MKKLNWVSGVKLRLASKVGGIEPLKAFDEALK